MRPTTLPSSGNATANTRLRGARLGGPILAAGLILTSCSMGGCEGQRPFWTSSERSGSACPEPYTIYCIDYRGREHKEVVDNLAAALRRRMEPRKVHVTHDLATQYSTLFYGEYCPRTRGPAPFPKNSSARKDLAKIRSLALASGEGKSPFAFARLRPMPGGRRDTGPAEWNLCNARKKVSDDPETIVWTLQIGVYHSNPARRKTAVEYVRNLRRDDKVQAYYLHYPAKSLVTLGAFSADQVETDRAGTFVDPVLREYAKRFPHWRDNGELLKQTYPVLDSDGERTVLRGVDPYKPSLLIEVPACGATE